MVAVAVVAVVAVAAVAMQCRIRLRPGTILGGAFVNMVSAWRGRNSSRVGPRQLRAGTRMRAIREGALGSRSGQPPPQSRADCWLSLVLAAARWRVARRTAAPPHRRIVASSPTRRRRGRLDFVRPDTAGSPGGGGGGPRSAGTPVTNQPRQRRIAVGGVVCWVSCVVRGAWCVVRRVISRRARARHPRRRLQSTRSCSRRDGSCASRHVMSCTLTPHRPCTAAAKHRKL